MLQLANKATPTTAKADPKATQKPSVVDPQTRIMAIAQTLQMTYPVYLFKYCLRNSDLDTFLESLTALQIIKR